MLLRFACAEELANEYYKELIIRNNIQVPG